jgi:hypothetical protein
MDWNEQGRIFAQTWEPGTRLPEFPNEQAKKDFTEGYATGWWERGSDDAKYGRERRTSFPSKLAARNYVDGWEDEAGDWDD